LTYAADADSFINGVPPELEGKSSGDKRLEVGEWVRIDNGDFKYGPVTAIDGDMATVHVEAEMDEWGYPSSRDVTPHDVTLPLAHCMRMYS
jgi:hypothetical protein